MTLNNIFLAIAITFLFVIFPSLAFAQGGPPKTPIDGGLSLLLAAGGVYGLKKVRDMRKEKHP